MIATFPGYQPVGAAIRERLHQLMDIILHLGVHRTGFGSLHSAFKAEHKQLDQAHVAVWGPNEVRAGMFDGIQPDPGANAARKRGPTRAAGRIKLRIQQLEDRGYTKLLISDPGLLGSLQSVVKSRRLYPAAGERAARLIDALPKNVSRVVLNVRSLDRYWASVFSRSVAHGYASPDDAALQYVLDAPRSWRDVVLDVACAVPDVDLRVLPFEAAYASPSVFMQKAAGVDVEFKSAPIWKGRSPTQQKLQEISVLQGRTDAQYSAENQPWMPFGEKAEARLREVYQDDLFWLENGAEGFAKLAKKAVPSGGRPRQPGAQKRGQLDEFEFRVEDTG